MASKWERSWEGKLSSPEKWLIEELRHLEDGNDIAAVLLGDLKRLQEARAKHVDFAFGQWEAIGYLEAEVGETAQEVVKGREGWETRMDEELKDVRVVALRMSLREYEHGEDA